MVLQSEVGMRTDSSQSYKQGAILKLRERPLKWCIAFNDVMPGSRLIPMGECQNSSQLQAWIFRPAMVLQCEVGMRTDSSQPHKQGAILKLRDRPFQRCIGHGAVMNGHREKEKGDRRYLIYCEKSTNFSISAIPNIRFLGGNAHRFDSEIK